ncbi:hypothetical protein ACSQ67_002432 [Phaseolus vulgaris]
MKFNMPVHDNGVIHFISDCGSYITEGIPYFEPYIMSYNLKNGTSTMLKLSETARKSSTDKKCDMSIFKRGKVSMASSSICLVRLKKSTFKVEILEDYKTSYPFFKSSAFSRPNFAKSHTNNAAQQKELSN